MEVGLKMEETELCLGLGLGLGLPGGGGGGGGGGGEREEMVVKSGGGVVGNKRGFSETMDLKLHLTNTNNISINNGNSSAKDQTVNSPPLDLMMKNDKVSSAVAANKEINNKVAANDDHAKPPAKAQVVGWPPVRSYRKNMLAVHKSGGGGSEDDQKSPMSGGLVKVSMDGAPYLRKVDLKMYQSYQDLSDALGKMFSSFTLGNYGAQGMIDFMNESKLMDLINGSDYVPTYEDKDGDWMLVGDVPWEMFVDSCKRLRIMKGKEAAGLVSAPRAVEKCKNRS